MSKIAEVIDRLYERRYKRKPCFAEWRGFFGVTVSDAPFTELHPGNWYVKHFWFPWSAYWFARKIVPSKLVQHATVYFHPHAWTTGKAVCRVVKMGNPWKLATLREFPKKWEPWEWMKDTTK